MSQTKHAINFRNIGKGIRNAGRAYSTGARQVGRSIPGVSKLSPAGQRTVGALTPAAGVGTLGSGLMNSVGDEPGLAGQAGDALSQISSQVGDTASRLGGQAVEGIADAGDATSNFLGGLFEEGGALGGVGDWWRDLDPKTKKAIMYSALAGGAGIGGYGLYRMLGGGGQQQPAYA